MTENSIYSVNSKWGILISNEQHILIGGKKPFIEKILTLFPDYDERLSDFLGLWQDYKNEFDTDISWIQTILGRFRFTNN
ncbi:MAG: hypothetical protein GWN01_13120 [Nitrosopumilaceae archaeon]|nr:hypothetical protein [Nitrosopumilaceae archaeon]NIU01805.1 hypothetical protein [Nitrosopumilaceae archaeon]NIU88213.1 hypothetical protein [Nitrosopumilaceae archaeon]NIV66526.1 hypothetical protein [Nitrosopumilaceae archaeon]NIX62407.1 hypothetical protein [Nitrosopumilaceae archaeon]